MAVRAMLENLDGVPEALHGEYKEQDVKIGGKTEKRFVLQVEGVEAHPNVVALKNAHETQKEANRTLREERDQMKGRLEGLPEDFSAEMFTSVKAIADGKAPAAEEQIRNARADEAKKLQKEIDKRDQRNAKLEKNLRTRVIDDGLNAQLAAAGVAKELIAGARAMIKEQMKIDMIEDGDRLDARIEGELGPQSIEEFVTSWVGSDIGKAYVAKPSGGGAEGGDGNTRPLNGGNPFVRKDGKIVNRTAIQDAVQKDRGKAIQQAKQAGWSDADLKTIGL